MAQKIELSNQLCKLFPEVEIDGKIPEQTKEKFENLPIDKLVEILSETNKGRYTKPWSFFQVEKVKGLKRM